MISGQLSVSARFYRGQLHDLAVRLDRPAVARLFLRMVPARVLSTVPLVFTLCAKAQTLAAEAALAAAQGWPPPSTEDSSALWVELLHEHLWRLLLDWPAALDMAPAGAAFSQWRKARSSSEIVPLTEALLSECLTGCGLDGDSLPTPDSLAGRSLAVLGEGGVPVEPAFCTGAWMQYLQGGRDRPMAGVRPQRLAEAYQGLLAETLRAARALRQGTRYPLVSQGEGAWGVAQTLTARGLLTHGVQLENGRVAAYHVWAPTDVCFADAQALAALVREMRFADRESAQRGLERAVLALDPCVPYSVAVRGEE